MNSKYILILSIFIILSWDQASLSKLKIKSFYSFSKPILKHHYLKLKEVVPENGASLMHAIVTGDKSKIKKNKLDHYKHMGLMHILTPSGLHLGSIMWVQKYLKPQVFIFGLFLLSLFISFLPGYFPIKRILLFKWLKLITKSKSNELLFFITFILDLCFGFYGRSPFSSLLSFLFWGTIITHEKYTNLSLLRKMAINMLLVNLIFHQETNCLAFFINPLISFFIGLFFPVLIFCYGLFPIMPIFGKGAAYLLSFMDQGISFIDLEILRLAASSFSLFLIIAISLKTKKFLILVLLLGSHSAGEEWKIKVSSGKWLKSPSGETWRP